MRKMKQWLHNYLIRQEYEITTPWSYDVVAVVESSEW